jgi:hypothetical protein
MALQIRFEWHVLRDGGTLTLPEPVGPYYDEDNLNCSDEGNSFFDSREEAIARLEKWFIRHGRFVGSDYVLVESFSWNDDKA